RTWPPIQQTGRAQDERPRADRQHRRPTRRGPSQRVQDLWRITLANAGRGDGHQISAHEPFETVRRSHHYPVTGRQRLSRLERAHPEVELRHAILDPVDAEHLCEYTELEQRDVIEQHHRDSLQHAAHYGRNLSHPVSIATRGTN